MNQYVVILAPWGSGSSAYAGVMDHLGAYTCPPHLGTMDPLTPSTYEPLGLLEILNRHLSEQTLLFTGDGQTLSDELKAWLSETVPDVQGDQVVSLKHALLCL